MQKILKFLQTTPFRGAHSSIVSADASFRKYYRLQHNNTSYILMDTSLEKDTLAPFLDITNKLHRCSVYAPKIYYEELQNGYLILEDFGDVNLLDKLTQENFEHYYKQAIDTIVKMQQADTTNLPLYDKAFLHQEMALMQEWYLEKKLSLTLSQAQQRMLHTTLESIVNTVLSQPQGVFVHRDFHSRNIMLTPSGALGIIDYQDAMCGAVTYDLVSLLKDCYIAFDRDKIETLALHLKERLALDATPKEFLKWFDFTGMQRHIKVLGIFSRLHLRDGKDGYLKDIPLTRSYLIKTASRYNETQALAEFLREFGCRR